MRRRTVTVTRTSAAAKVSNEQLLNRRQPFHKRIVNRSQGLWLLMSFLITESVVNGLRETNGFFRGALQDDKIKIHFLQ